LRHLILAIALLTLAPAAALAAGDRGFQFEVDAVGSLPSGTYEFGDRAGDLFDYGGNAFGRALFGLSRGLYVGAAVGYLQNQKDFTRTSLLDTRPSFPLSGTRTMHAIPVLGIIQVRSDTHHRLSWYGEGGLGVTTFDRRLTNLAFGSFALPPEAVFQQGLSFLVGGGTCLGLGRNFDLLVGTSYLQSFTHKGPAWESGDNPAYVLGSIGVRYPRW
jgi:hypothetical protein